MSRSDQTKNGMPRAPFGIPVRKWCREHERLLDENWNDPDRFEELLFLHEKKLSWLMHERLVHFLVTMTVILLELFVCDLAILHPQTDPYAALAALGILVLLIFYLYHYFFLENRVQSWYRIDEALLKKLHRTKAGERRQEDKKP